MTRREIREHVFKELFLTEFYSAEEYAEQCEMYRNDLEGATEAELQELKEKAAIIGSKVDELDARINEAADRWKTHRMGKVELTILRLAVFEMQEDEKVPVSVAINEAVELAKQYGGDDAPAFVNAILGKVAKGMEE